MARAEMLWEKYISKPDFRSGGAGFFLLAPVSPQGYKSFT
jgi:hypothetical protein